MANHADWALFVSDLECINYERLSKTFIGYACNPEGIRMVRGLIRNQLPGDRLRVRLPCPPLFSNNAQPQALSNRISGSTGTCQLAEHRIDIIGHDHAVIDGT